MKKAFISLFVVFVLLSSNVGIAEAAALTQSQISAIIGLLRSFGADEGTIASVNSALTGTGTSVPPVPSSSAITYCPTIRNTLYRGSSDSWTKGEVSILQRFLRQLYPDLPVTGYFGVLTEEAVIRFQNQYGISAVGIVGPETSKKIASLCTPVGYPIDPLPPVSAGYLQIEPSGLNLYVGGTGELKAYYQPPMPPCPSGAFCTQVMPARQLITAQWSSSNPLVAAVRDSAQTGLVHGISQGNADIKAMYTVPGTGTVLTERVIAYVKNVSSITVLSPNGGEQFQLGSTQPITWTTGSFGKTYAISVADKDGFGQGNIATVTGVAADKQVYYWNVGQVKVPSDRGDIQQTLGLGNYKIFILEVETGSSDYSNAPFSIIGGTQSLLTVSSATIIGSQSTYTAGQTIKFSVKGVAFDGSTGVPGIPGKGFNVQAWMYKLDSSGNTLETVQVGGVYQSFNANYNSSTGYWDVAMTASSDASQTYKIEVAFYCANSSLGCSSGQINKSFTFTISSAVPSITVTSPNGGEAYKAGGQIAINWSESGFTPKDMRIYLNGSALAGQLVPTLASLGASTQLSFSGVLPNVPSGTDYVISVCDEGTPSPIVSFKPLCGNSAPFSIVAATGVIPTLNVSLDASTPTSVTLKPGQTSVKFAQIKATAGSSPVNNLNGIQIGSDSSNASAFLTNFKVFDGATQIGGSLSEIYWGGGYYQNWIMLSGVSIPANTSKIFTVVADVKPTAPSGSVRLGIAGWNFNAPGVSVVPFGTPIYGNSMTIGAATVTPSITVLSPNGGETLQQGQQFTIRWTTGDPASFVGLNLLQNDNHVLMIGNVSNTGSYVWTVPSTFLGSNFKVRIFGNTVDTSNAPFSIVNNPALATPVFTKLSVPTNTLTNGTQVLYRFRATTVSSQDASISSLQFPISLTGVAPISLSDISLYGYSDSGFSVQAYSANPVGQRYGSIGSTVVVFSQGDFPLGVPLTIPAGTSRYFEVRGYVNTGSFAPVSIITSLSGLGSETLTKAAPIISPNPVGFIGPVTDKYIYGWACVPGDSRNDITVRVKTNAGSWTTIANTPRGEAGFESNSGCNGVYHGFELPTPTLSAGTYIFTATVIDPRTGTEVSLTSVSGQTTLTVISGAPSLSSVYPNTVIALRPELFNIYGSYFQSGAMVVYSGPSSGTLAASFVNSTNLVLSVPGGLLQGTYSFKVLNPPPDGKESNSLSVVATAPIVVVSAPVLSSVTPASVTALQTTTFILTGSYFQSGAQVVYSGPSSGTISTTLLPSSLQSSQLSVLVSGGLFQGTYTFYVRNLDGKVSNSLSVVATAPVAVIPAPTLSYVTPSSVTALQTTTFVIIGDYFQPGAIVVYSGPSSGTLSTTFYSKSELRVAVPGGLLQGNYSFKVLNPPPDGKESGTLSVQSTAPTTGGTTSGADLVAVSISPSGPFTVGQSVTFSAVVQNAGGGQMPGSGYDADLMIDYGNDNSTCQGPGSTSSSGCNAYIGSPLSVPLIAPAATHTFSIPWTATCQIFTAPCTHLLRFRVDLPYNLMPESIESNNYITKLITVNPVGVGDASSGGDSSLAALIVALERQIKELERLLKFLLP